MFALGYFLLLIGLFVLTDLAAGRPGGPFFILFGIAFLGLLIPSLAVQVRRFHDQDRRGRFVLLDFIPYVGGVITLIFMCLEGTRGENRFGPDPKGRPEDVADIFR
jgi:uncharacterized membrane protein YhaH (DUF805 family)